MCVWNDIKKVAAVGAVVAVVLAAAPTLLADRPTDKDVKGLIDRINSERDRFEDQLDGKIKSSIIRGPNGEVHVERYLDDLQDNVGKLKDRYKGDYAARTTATTAPTAATFLMSFHTHMSHLPFNRRCCGKDNVPPTGCRGRRFALAR